MTVTAKTDEEHPSGRVLHVTWLNQRERGTPGGRRVTHNAVLTSRMDGHRRHRGIAASEACGDARPPGELNR